jgi:flagellar protein FlaG
VEIESSQRLESAQPATSGASGGATGDNGAGIPETDLKKAEMLRAMIADKNMQLRTYHDEASGHSVLEVSDQATGQVVSQYPSEELLRLYAALREPFVDQSA